MKTAVYSAHKFERDYLLAACAGKHELRLLETRLNRDTADLAKGCEAACIFAHDDASAEVLGRLSAAGVKYLALRSAGFNHLDLEHAARTGIRVCRVPEYSPYAVAEHTVALMLALNRKLIRAHYRVMEQNFSLDGLAGFDMKGKTAGIIGTGRIGSVVAGILHGFGCRLLAADSREHPVLKQKYDVTYTDCETLCRNSDIITLHVPLTDETRYIINGRCISMMKPSVMLINTSRGGLVNTREVIAALKTGHIGFFGLDVYEEEEGLFFEDHSGDILQDDIIARLMTFRNVLITSHQAFLTDTALQNIAGTTATNLTCLEEGKPCGNELFAKEAQTHR